MIDLRALTKDYYSKSEMEKEHIKGIIYADLIQITIVEELDYFQLKDVVENFNGKMIEIEDYEIVDIINSVFKQVEINYFDIKQDGL
jgi:hypothetical protein